jgi:O-antigen/teichoic acid export membrane protein
VKLPLGNKDTLLGRASRALTLSFISVAVLRFSTLGVGVLLARLLGPRAFGTYAVALVALLAVLSFNELGVSLAIVRWPGEPSEIAPTVATISCVSSVLLFIGFYLGAPAFANAMGAPAATPVIRVLSASILVNCVAAVPAAMLQRQFRQDRKLVADQVHSWLFTAIAIAMAWAGFGAMSLAVASVVGATAGGILLMVFSHPPRFGFDPVKARALLKFGLPLAGSSFVVFLVGNVDNVIVGHMLGATALGFYVLAWNLSSWPVTMFSLPVRSVAPALFSRLQHDRAAMHIGFLSGVGLLASVTLPVCLLMSGSAVPLVDFAYGSRWAQAAPILVWLAGVAALRILFELSYDYFVVLARSRVVFTVQLAWFVALVPALIVAIRIDGVRGAAIAGLAVAGGVVLPWYLIELHKVGIRVGAVAAKVWMPLLGGAAVGLSAADLAGLLANNLTVLLVSGMVALSVIGLLIYHRLPELAMLRSVLRNADVPAAADQQATEHSGEPGQERVYEHATEPFGERVNGRAVPVAPAHVSWPLAADVTMPLPALRAQLPYRVVIDDLGSAADVTAPLPIYRDVVALRRPSAEAGLGPMQKNSVDAWRELRASRRGASWIADQQTVVNAIPHSGRHARPQAPGESDGATGPDGHDNDG